MNVILNSFPVGTKVNVNGPKQGPRVGMFTGLWTVIKVNAKTTKVQQGSRILNVSPKFLTLANVAQKRIPKVAPKVAKVAPAASVKQEVRTLPQTPEEFSNLLVELLNHNGAPRNIKWVVKGSRVVPAAPVKHSVERTKVAGPHQRVAAAAAPVKKVVVAKVTKKVADPEIATEFVVGEKVYVSHSTPAIQDEMKGLWTVTKVNRVTVDIEHRDGRTERIHVDYLRHRSARKNAA